MVKTLDQVKVVKHTIQLPANLQPDGKLPWQTYQTVRNTLVQTCRRFGPTGPMGIVKIAAEISDPYRAIVQDREFWEPGDPTPTYYLIPDQYNYERYCHIELYGSNSFTADWLLGIVTTLQEFKGWGLYIKNIPHASILIIGNRIFVSGRLGRCKSASEVVEKTQALLNRGQRKWWQFW
jgi:hypothetical protein